MRSNGMDELLQQPAVLQEAVLGEELLPPCEADWSQYMAEGMHSRPAKWVLRSKCGSCGLTKAFLLCDEDMEWWLGRNPVRDRRCGNFMRPTILSVEPLGGWSDG